MDEPGTMRHTAVIEYLNAPIIWFYAELGFDTLVAEEIPDSDYMTTLSGGELSNISIGKYANTQGSIVEVISIPSERPPNPPAWSHIAVSVHNCAAMVESLVTRGGSLVGGPVESTSGPYVVAYVRDPSGNLVELVQRLPASE